MLMRLDAVHPIADKILLLQKSKIAAVAIFKIQKIGMFPQQNDQFGRHLAR